MTNPKITKKNAGQLIKSILDQLSPIDAYTVIATLLPSQYDADHIISLVYQEYGKEKFFDAVVLTSFDFGVVPELQERLEAWEQGTYSDKYPE